MQEKNVRVLIVDDEESIRKLLATRFQREGWDIVTAEDGHQGLQVAQNSIPTVIVSDIKMPGMDGFQFIEAIRKANVMCPVIMITGHGEKECAIESMHKGAFDYLEKPFDMDAITLTVKRAIEREKLRTTNEQLMKDLAVANSKLTVQLEVKTELLDRAEKEIGADEILIGKSSHIQNIKDMVRTIADSFSGDHEPVVLVTGESGVGKEVVARYIHATIYQNNHKDKPFVAINCAAFPDQLLESELFGYEKGAFTGATQRKLGLFELANGGTIFLDEIGEMDVKMQAKLLRVLQERVIRRVGGTADITVKPHIVAATNRDLAKAVSEKTFREDLYYRLNTIPITIAPLRSRSEDIEILAMTFMKKFSSGKGKRFSGFSTSALKTMMTYSWPGNVRELKSVVERAMILEKGPVIELSHLRQEHLQALRTGITASVKSTETSTTEASVLPFQKTTTSTGMAAVENVKPPVGFTGGDMGKQIEEKGLTQLRKEMDENFVKQVLVEMLTADSGNVSAISRKLKLDRANLLRMLKRFAIQPEAFRMKKAS